MPELITPDLSQLLPRTISPTLQRGHTPAPYAWGEEPIADKAGWPPVPDGMERIPNDAWGLCRPIGGGDWLEPRYQNDVVRIMDLDYCPVSPATRQPESKPGEPWLFDHQIRIFNHVFTPRLNPDDGKYYLPYQKVLVADLKKSGKTALGGGIGYGWARTYGGEIYYLANSEDQAKDRGFTRLYQYLTSLRRRNLKEFRKQIKTLTGEKIESRDAQYPGVGAVRNNYLPAFRIQAVPVAAGSQAGGFQSLTVWDELWNYEHEEATRLYGEMQPISTIPAVTLPLSIMLGLDGHTDETLTVESPSIQVVVTYAGFHGESALLWALYEQAMLPDPENDLAPMGYKPEGLEDLPCYVSPCGTVFAYWNSDTPRMPWQTPRYYKLARNEVSNQIGGGIGYMRLHRNHWTSQAGHFLEMSTYDRCASEGDRKADRARVL